MVALSLIVVTAKRLMLFCVLALASWHIAASLTSGVPYGKVLVYVSEQPSTLTVDRQHYSITPQMSYPLVCELAPGRHVLRLERNGARIYEQAFTVEARREQTIFAPGRTGAYVKSQVASPDPVTPVVHPNAMPVIHRAAFRNPADDELDSVSSVGQ
jgi:hypothetical protein